MFPTICARCDETVSSCVTALLDEELDILTRFTSIYIHPGRSARATVTCLIFARWLIYIGEYRGNGQSSIQLLADSVDSGLLAPAVLGSRRYALLCSVPPMAQPVVVYQGPA
jgi:hypothetical protein